MLKAILALLSLLLLSALCAIWVIDTELGGGIAPATQGETSSREPAPYPEAMANYLANLQDIKIRILPEQKLPSTLQWQRGEGEPEIGDPAALKGGTLRIVNVGPFPKHFRPFGGVTPLFFNYTLYKSIDLQLVGLHPNTGAIIPALAEAWAVEGRSVTFQLNSKARYSNGRPLRAQDFLLGIYLRCSTHAQDPFALSALSQRIESIESLGDHMLRVTLKEESLLAPYLASELLHADEPSFYADYGSDYLTRYSKRAAPTTGGYSLMTEKMLRGRQVKLSRVKDWWAKDEAYYRNSCNVDTIEINFLQDEAQLWELFLSKRIDFIQSRNVVTWRQRLECEAAWKGKIEKRIFKANYPFPVYGIYLNCKTLPELELRQGIMLALDMDSAIQLIFQGEAERLSCFTDGYKKISPKDIPQQSYRPEQARAIFERLGFSELGSDGILQKPDGTRLSLSLDFTPSDKVSTLVKVLSERARAAGLELLPRPAPWQETAKRVENKQHQLAFWADVLPSPLPKIDSFFHSQYKDTVGKNLHGIDDAQLDAAINAMNSARNMTELASATRDANLRIQELALWLAGWKENTAYIASWRHLRFPNTPDCHFAPPSPYEVLESHLYWIDPSYTSDGSYPEVDERINSKQ